MRSARLPENPAVPSDGTQGVASGKARDVTQVEASPSTSPPCSTSEQTPTSSSLRAEHEDDDGYDPYSDRTAPKPLFERDPWD
jgi:hypothetical protein